MKRPLNHRVSPLPRFQFRSRIAFKLVWVPPAFTSFVLADDSGSLLNSGMPTGRLPAMGQRQMNFELVRGSKYATAAQAHSGGGSGAAAGPGS